MVKVSIVMLAYNSAKYIETAIKGVVNQKTGFKFQLVISDDKSSDGTYEICLKYKNLYPEIITLNRNEHNIGLQANFMRAYELCCGEYIAMCDGDDYWFDRHKLKIMVDYMDTNRGCAIVFHRVVNYFQGIGTKSLSNGGQRENITVNDLAISNTITNCSCMFRKGNCPILPAWISEIKLCDYAMHIINGCKGTIHYIKRPMAVYRQHRNAVWSQKGHSNREEQFVLALHVREVIIDNMQVEYPDLCDRIRKTHARFSINAMAYFRKHGLTDSFNRIKARLQKYSPEITDEELNSQIDALYKEERRTMLRTLIKQVLKKGRAFVSFFVPLPKP